MKVPFVAAIVVAVGALAGFGDYRTLNSGAATKEVSSEAPRAPAQGALHKGRGVVTGISAPDGYLELKHDPIPSMQMPSMQMGFSVPDRKLLEGLKKSDVVDFEMRGVPNKDGDFVIEHLTREAATK